jgi:hypothetical protein
MSKQEQRQRTGIFGLLVGIFVIIALIYLIADAGHSESPSTIDITKTAEEEISPDRVMVSFSIVTLDKDINAAIEENSQVNNRIMDALDDEYTVETTQYTVNERREWNREEETYEVIGFEVYNTITVTTHDVDATGEIITEATSLGANRVNNIRFELSDERKEAVKEKLQREAVRSAREDAETLAELSNVKVVGITSITPHEFSYPPVYYARSMDMAMEGSAATAPDIAPSAQMVSYSVTIRFEIR